MLAEMVEAGALPPVEERVSEEPLVREVLGEIGRYGGTLRRWGPDAVDGWIQLTYYRGLGDAGGFGFIIPYDLAGYLDDGLHFGGLDPLYAKEYQFNDDFTELTVWHRRGIKWSDGHPLTADDIIWTMDEVGNDVNIHPNGTWWSRSGGEPITVEKIDDYTVKYVSAIPNPDLTLNVSGPWAVYPRHYAEQFHPKFNADSTYEEFRNNTELRFMDDPGAMPQVGPWVVTRLDPVEGAFATRNPYYPVVDTEGNQLPYIDDIHIRILADQQVAALSVIQGQIDVQGRHMQGFQNYQVMKENEAQGDYRVLVWKGGAFPGLPQAVLRADRREPGTAHVPGRLPSGAVAGDRPGRDQRSALLRTGAALRHDGRARVSVLTTAGWKRTADSTRIRPGASSPSWASRTPTATASCNTRTATTSSSSSTRRPTGSSIRRLRRWSSGSGETSGSTRYSMP